MGYYYVNGQKIYRLEEAVITKPKYLSGTKPLKALEAHDLKEEKFKKALDWVLSIPGIYTKDTLGKKIISYGQIKQKEVHISLENIPEDFGTVDMSYLLANIPINCIDRAEYTTSADDQCMYIFLKFKKGTDFTLRGLDFYRFIPLGYHQPAEFYVPRYEVKEDAAIPSRRKANAILESGCTSEKRRTDHAAFLHHRPARALHRKTGRHHHKRRDDTIYNDN